MTRLYPRFLRRSQNSTSLLANLIIVDRKTLRNLSRVLLRCLDDVQAVNHSEIMLTSLDNYLSEEKNVNINKSILLLRYWLEFSPERLKQVEDRLDEAHETMKVILEATK